MDRQLLDALDNIGNALDELVKALKTDKKSDDKNPVAVALKSGKFEKQLDSINNSIRSIKSDTTTILKNQKTIIDQGKENNKATSTMEIDKKKENDIKKGVAVIMLIALAVLAIGMAFKIVGNVNILSAIGLSLAITILGVAFEKMAQLKLEIEDTKRLAVVMVILSASILASGIILSFMPNVSFVKITTAVLIAGGFALIAPSIVKVIKGLSGIGVANLIKGLIVLPFILPIISLGIVLSSYMLSSVMPISPLQAFSAILIAGVFAVVSYGIRNLLRAFKGIGPLALIMAAVFLPVIMASISRAIYDSSIYLGGVKPMSLSAFFGSIMVGLVFAVLSFGLKSILRAFKGLSPVEAAIAAVAIPSILIAISYAISAASDYISEVKSLTLNQFLVSLGISILFVVLSFMAKRIVDGVKDIKPLDFIKVPVFFIVMSYAIQKSSEILSEAKVIPLSNLINIGLLGIGLALLTFVYVPAFKVASKLQVNDLVKGGLVILGISVVITAASHILSMGKYKNYPSLDWALGVSLSLFAFGTGAVLLGMAVFGPQALLFAAGLAATLTLAGTIVLAAEILNRGNYTGGPTEKWSKGISLALGAFIPLYDMMVTSSILKFFGMDTSPERFNGVIKLISNGLVYVAKLFAENEAVYKKGPPESWAKGVSLSIGAFIPLYDILLKSEVLKFFGMDVSPEQFKKAINTIIDGIIYTAHRFAGVNFSEYPKPEWSDGVSKSIGAFSKIFEIVGRTSFFSESSSQKIKNIANGIDGITTGIIDTAIKFRDSNIKWDVYPNKDWSKNVKYAIEEYIALAQFVFLGKPNLRFLTNVVDTFIYQVARKIYYNSFAFEKGIPNNYLQSLNNNITSLTMLDTFLSIGKSDFSSVTNASRKLVRVAKILFNDGVDIFSTKIDPDYVKNMSSNIYDFIKLTKDIEKSSEQDANKGVMDIFQNDPIIRISRRLIRLADGYDKLANSLIKLSTAMRLLNISDFRVLTSFTRDLSLLTDFRNDLTRQQMNTNTNNNVNRTTTSQIQPVQIPNFLKKEEKDKDNKINENLEKLIELITNIELYTKTVNLSMLDMNADKQIQSAPTAGNNPLSKYKFW